MKKKRVNNQDNIFSEGDIARVKKCYIKNEFNETIKVGTTVRIDGERSFLHKNMTLVTYEGGHHYYPETHLQKSHKHTSARKAQLDKMYQDNRVRWAKETLAKHK